MDAELLLHNFPLIISRAEDVPRLNEAILQLAVQGKLVPQDPDDEPASDLLQRITAEKERLIAEKKIRKSKPLPEIGEEERPYPLPDGWEWAQFGDLVPDFKNGISKRRSSIGLETIVLRLADIKNGLVSLDDTRQIKLTEDERIIYSLMAEDILITRVNGSIDLVGNFTLVGDIGTVSYCDHFIRIRFPLKSIYMPYLVMVGKSRLLRKQIEDRFITTAGQKTVNQTHIRTLKLPIPPLPEQKRIVARVDTLLAQTRQLQTSLAEAQQSLTTLHSAAVQELLKASGPDDFAAQWQFIRANFDALYDEAYPQAALANIAQLKQTILQLAVQGKLTRQDPTDEPAALLLQRIAAEKERLVAEKKIRKSKPLPEIGEEERPFDLPNGWEWARFPEIGEFGRGKSKHRPRNDPMLYENGKHPFVQTGEVARSNGTITSYTQKYSDLGLAQSKMWPKGTLCITIAANIAETGILGFDACFPDSVVGFVPSSLIGSVDYFQYFVAVAKNELEAYAPATAQKNINLGILQALLIPLPPLPEQKRIVTRVNTLLNLCDDLAAHIQAAQTTRTALRDAVLRNL